MDTLVIIKRIEMRLSQIGMSKAEFYSRSGISSASLSQWRTGTYKPSKKKLERAAEVLAVPVGYLLGDVTMNDDGYSFSDGSGYGGPMPRIETKKAPTETGERDVLDEVDIGFYNGYKELTEDDKATIRDMVQLMRQRRAEKSK